MLTPYTGLLSAADKLGGLGNLDLVNMADGKDGGSGSGSGVEKKKSPRSPRAFMEAITPTKGSPRGEKDKADKDIKADKNKDKADKDKKPGSGDEAKKTADDKKDAKDLLVAIGAEAGGAGGDGKDDGTPKDEEEAGAPKLNIPAKQKSEKELKEEEEKSLREKAEAASKPAPGTTFITEPPQPAEPAYVPQSGAYTDVIALDEGRRFGVKVMGRNLIGCA